MTKLSSKNILVLKIAAAALSVLLLFGFGLLPLFNKIITLNESTDETRIQLEISRLQKNNLDETRKNYNLIKDKITNVSKVFVNPDDLLKTVDDLERVASLSEVSQNISLSNYGEVSAEHTIDFTLSASGSWPQVITYLSNLESLDYYVLLSNPRFVSSTQVTISAAAKIFIIQ